MRNYQDKFPSRYLKADDLKGRKKLVTIDKAVDEMMGQGSSAEEKTVVYFRGEPKGLPLNRTNGDSIADVTGTGDMDAWPGHQIVLYPTKTELRGKRVPCIRIEEPPTASAPPERISAETQAFVDALEDDDDEVAS